MPLPGPAARVLMLGFAVPWAILIVVAEPDRADRWLWIWPLQVALLAGTLDWLLARLPWRTLRLLVVAGSIALTAFNAHVAAVLDNWRVNGWGGQPSRRSAIVERLADGVRAEGGTHAAVGYHTWFWEFMVHNAAIDRRYKQGWDLDTLLAQHGVTNTNRCPEGLSAADEWRIVQTGADAQIWGGRAVIGGDFTEGFEPRAIIGPYTLYRRETAGAGRAAGP